MTQPLGLSIGMTNLVAARVGRPPVMRRAILHLFNDRPAEVGVPAENPNVGQPGALVLSGFVDRVGDPVPLVAADGSAHRGELVLAEALEAMARTVDGGAPIAIAVPAHWGPGTVGALRGALRTRPGLAPGGLPAALIPDSTAALAALQAAPGLPDQGVVVLVDLGGSGTSISLADAGANLDALGPTVRYPDFSGDAVDQALLNHVVTGIAEANNADPAGTAAVGSLARLREQCRLAKERLSADTATVVSAELPGFTSDIRVTRPELEQLISEPVAGLMAAIEDTLQRNQVPPGSVAAVATVGGGAAIPLITQRLSERLRAPVVTTPQPQLNVAAGAALIADQSTDADAPTGMAPAAAGQDDADAPTGLAPWAAGAAGLAAGATASDGASSATFRALAWSQDDAPAGEPVPYTGADYTADPGATGARPPVAFASDEPADDSEPGPLPWYKRPPLLFGAAAAAALLAIGGLAVTLTSTSGDSSPVTETATTFSMEPSPSGALPPPVTTVTVGPDGRATTTVSQPPPPPPPSSSTTSATTTTTQPTTTTTATTTTTTRTTTTTTRPTTTPPPTTTAPPPTTTAPPPTTVDPPDPVTTTVIDPGA
jgi:hypothetical protein